MVDFNGVIAAWDTDARTTGGRNIHPFASDTPEYWESGRVQAKQVTKYAEPGDLVIDFGCGNGRLSIPLAEMGFEVWAVDSSQRMLDDLEHRVTVPTMLVLSDGTNIARLLGPKKAAVVIARAVFIHHDYEGVERVVTELVKTLKGGGHLIADWPIGKPHIRANWNDITRWDYDHRLEVAERAGLEEIEPGNVSVWRKR